jgi:hypothetical protein
MDYARKQIEGWRQEYNELRPGNSDYAGTVQGLYAAIGFLQRRSGLFNAGTP